MGFDVRHTLILSPWGEIQRLQGLCLWRGWAEAQFVGLRSCLFCSLFSCFSIMYFTWIIKSWAASTVQYISVHFQRCSEQLGCTWEFEKLPTLRLLLWPECPYAPGTLCLILKGFFSFAYNVWTGAPYQNITGLEKVPGPEVRKEKNVILNPSLKWI